MNTIRPEKILVAYFSQKGKETTSNSAKLAKQAEEILKAKGVDFDTFAIVPTEIYPEDKATMELVTKTEKESRVRPELVGKYSGMKYITGVLLIAPNWWNSLPQAVYTFFDEYDFADTRVVPVICTNEGDAKAPREEVRDFLQNWVLPGVAILDSDVDNASAQLNEAVNQLFEKSNEVV